MGPLRWCTAQKNAPHDLQIRLAQVLLAISCWFSHFSTDSAASFESCSFNDDKERLTNHMRESPSVVRQQIDSSAD